MSVKRRLTAKRVRETPEYAAMVRRIIRAHGRRVGDADPEDLAEMLEMREVLDEAIAEAVTGNGATGSLGRRSREGWAQRGRRRSSGSVSADRLRR